MAPAKPDDNRFDVKPALPSVIAASPLSDEEAKRSFVLRRFDIKGARAFAASDLRALYAHALDRRITMAELYAIVDSIRQRYMDEGYTLSRIALVAPPTPEGAVSLQVTEGYVTAVDIDRGFADVPLIRAFVREVKAMRPLNTRRLERVMLVLNSRPGINATSVLSAGAAAEDAEQGRVQLSLKEKSADMPRSFVSFDNYGSRFTGPAQLSMGTMIRDVGLNYDDVFLSGGFATQWQEMHQMNAEYTLPLFGISGTLLQIAVSANRTEPGARLEPLDVEGQASSVSAKISYPVVMQRDEHWVLSALLDVKNTETDILGSRLFNDQLRVVNLGSRYSVSDDWKGLNRLQVTASQGLDALGARKTGSADLSRVDGRSDFTKLEMSASRLQSFTTGLDLLATVQAQHTKDPLLSSEEFGVGGAAIGRGYDPSEITGDRGVSASAELRYNYEIPAWDSTLQPYGFYDVGKVWNIDPSDKNHASVTSAGAGVRLYASAGWSVDAGAAIPLTRPADEPPAYGNGHSPRYMLSVRKSF